MMKKFLIGTLCIGLASLGFSQSPKSMTEEVKLSDAKITPFDSVYLKNVQHGSISDRVFILEKKASRFNIKESPFFNRRGLGVVNFDQSKGKIQATYDNKGKIVSTYERYKDLLLPIAVRNAVYKAYPGWDMYGNTYQVTYQQNKGVKKFYKIKIRKDGLKKNLKFDVDGNRI